MCGCNCWYGCNVGVVVMWTGRRLLPCGVGGSGGGVSQISGGVLIRINLNMSSDSRSRSRSRSPLDRKIRSDRFSYRDAPYRRDIRRGFRFSDY